MISIPSHVLVRAAVFSHDTVQDVTGSDGYSFSACFTRGVLEPAVVSLDVMEVELTSEGSPPPLGQKLTLSVKMASDISDGSFTLVAAFDTDMNPNTGASEPVCYYNGLGADVDVGVEVVDGTPVSSWIDLYRNGSWVPSGEPTVLLVSDGVSLSFHRADVGNPVSGTFMVYVISDGVVDIAPEPGTEPPGFSIVFPPVAILDAPVEVSEGSEVVIDASGSIAYTSSGEPGEVLLYSFDLDGDGTYERQSTGALRSVTFSDDGVYPVSVLVTDSRGLTSTANVNVTVTNVAPTIIGINILGELFVGERVLFRGEATDPGFDTLTFRWDLGDGIILEGARVPYTYDVEGEVNVTVIVEDDDGGISVLEKIVVVKVPLPPLSDAVSLDNVTAHGDFPDETTGFYFKINVLCDQTGRDEPIEAVIRMYVDDPERLGAPHYESPTILPARSNVFMTPTWRFELGEHRADFFVVLFEDGTELTMPCFFESKAPGIGLDTLAILVLLIGVIGFIIYTYLLRSKGDGVEGKKPEADDEGGFCEEHPEVVEVEKKASRFRTR